MQHRKKNVDMILKYPRPHQADRNRKMTVAESKRGTSLQFL